MKAKELTKNIKVDLDDQELKKIDAIRLHGINSGRHNHFDVGMIDNNSEIHVGKVWNRSDIYVAEYPGHYIYELVLEDSVLQNSKDLVSAYLGYIIYKCIKTLKLGVYDVFCFNVVGLNKKILDTNFEIIDKAYAIEGSNKRISSILITDPIFAIPMIGFLKFQFMFARINLDVQKRKAQVLYEIGKLLQQNYDYFSTSPPQINRQKKRTIYPEYIDVVSFTALNEERPLKVALKNLYLKKKFIT